MPIYVYECEEHGHFESLRSFSESDDPIECPECGVVAKRVFTLPVLPIMNKATRHVHETNERSRHEPKLAKKSSCGHDHSHGESCSHGSSEKQTKKGALKSYGGPRPWVIEHPRT